MVWHEEILSLRGCSTVALKSVMPPRLSTTDKMRPAERSMSWGVNARSNCPHLLTSLFPCVCRSHFEDMNGNRLAGGALEAAWVFSDLYDTLSKPLTQTFEYREPMSGYKTKNTLRSERRARSRSLVVNSVKRLTNGSCE
jgi:hypothetical protein